MAHLFKLQWMPNTFVSRRLCISCRAPYMRRWLRRPRWPPSVRCCWLLQRARKKRVPRAFLRDTCRWCSVVLTLRPRSFRVTRPSYPVSVEVYQRLGAFTIKTLAMPSLHHWATRTLQPKGTGHHLTTGHCRTSISRRLERQLRLVMAPICHAPSCVSRTCPIMNEWRHTSIATQLRLNTTSSAICCPVHTPTPRESEGTSFNLLRLLSLLW